MTMNRERLIKDIQEFVGAGGYVAFEHGYKPTIAAYGVGYDHIDRQLKPRKVYFEEMNEVQLTNIILELFRYMNYCHLYA